VSGALGALLATLIVELPVVAVAYPGQRARMTLIALVANVLTNLALNVLLPAVPGLSAHRLLIGEALATGGEAAVYALASRPRDLGRALIVSGIANALSYELVGAVAARLAS
jgi:hypothetical protein